MYEVLKLLHVVGWSAWFGTAIAEASVGVQVRRATDAGGRAALARLWARLGRIQLFAMALALVFGLGLFAYELSLFPAGPAAFMRDRAHLFVHLMLAMGLLAGVFALLAGQARGAAVGALEGGQAEAFGGPYKRASMFSGMASLLLLATIVVVYLRTL